MVNKPTHDSGTIIDHLYMSQTLNTMQTDVTDCYHSDHDCISMFDNYLSNIYHIFMKELYMYKEYDIVHPNLVKYSQKCRSTQTSDINVSFILCQILRVVST